MEPHESGPTGTSNTLLRNILVAVAIVYVIASLYFIFETRSRSDLEKTEQDAVNKLTRRADATDRSIKVSTEALAQKVGMSQQDLQTRVAAKAEELERQQARMARQNQEQNEQIKNVSGAVANVKTDLGSTRTDLAATQTDLATTKAKLERAIGDLGVQSGLIARNHDDLEQLRRRGERNYYEFTLHKGASPTPVSTISLQLKKTNPKKSKFTLNVVADDKTIEKKDRNLAEPLQFYSGRDRMLYEVELQRRQGRGQRLLVDAENSVIGRAPTFQVPGVKHQAEHVCGDEAELRGTHSDNAEKHTVHTGHHPAGPVFSSHHHRGEDRQQAGDIVQGNHADPITA